MPGIRKAEHLRLLERIAELEIQLRRQNPELPPFEHSLPIRQIGEKCSVILIQLRNLNVEIQLLRAEQAKLRSLVLTLLADPQAREDAMAVIKAWGVSNASTVKPKPH